MSENGDGDGSGKEMAMTITTDINYMKIRSWIYWQVIE